MKKLKNKGSFLIVLALFFVLFNVITLLLTDFSVVKGAFWCAYAFSNLAFVAVAVLIGITKFGKNDVISLYSLQYLATAVYCALTLLINVIFMIAASKSDKVTALIIINLILIVAYVAVLIVSNMGTSYIKKNEANIAAKVSKLRGLEVKVSTLTYSTTDADVKKKLNELKEKFHFSDPMTNDAVAEIENEIEQMLEIIGNLIASGAESEAVLGAVNDCITKVKIRNQTLLASK